MLTLSLLRHAKSSWEDGSLKDFERPLAKRGESAAPRMGAFMAERGLAPQLILCSPAVRARQTLDLVLPHLAGDPSVLYEDRLYLAAPSALLARLRRTFENFPVAYLARVPAQWREQAADAIISGQHEQEADRLERIIIEPYPEQHPGGKEYDPVYGSAQDKAPEAALTCLLPLFHEL